MPLNEQRIEKGTKLVMMNPIEWKMLRYGNRLIVLQKENCSNLNAPEKSTNNATNFLLF